MALQQSLVRAPRIAHDARRPSIENGEIGILASHEAARADERAATKSRVSLDQRMRPHERIGADMHRPGDPTGAPAGGLDELAPKQSLAAVRTVSHDGAMARDLDTL